MEAFNRYNAHYQQGQYSEAIRYATEALNLAEDEFGPDHPNTAKIRKRRKALDFDQSLPLLAA